jgi:hypothetical protein
MDGWVGGRQWMVNKWVDGWMDGWVGGRQWMVVDGWMGGWMIMNG